ncbi:rRNA maturation RNase YbeY [Compostibacter hankyongensis]|uniref:Endoribonuclease YbeY n=2 Tax=Compostibacter hankyongensis TaxID=1007089 RepID=A0ABP8FCA8_9BACT
MAVRFFQEDVSLPLRDRRRLKAFLEQLGRQEGRPVARLHYIFCTDEYLLEINRQFLHHDTYTDIITFDLSEAPGALQGEIYISLPRVRENAEKFGAGFDQELHRVIFHGLLHLCGYKDKTKDDRQQMRKKEEEYLTLYFK